MDARRKQTFPALLAGCGLMFAAAINADADVRIAAYSDEHIESGHHHTGLHLDGDDVVIVADDRSEARVTPTGNLYVAGRPVAVNASQRAMLRKYNAGIHDIETRGLEIGKSALKLVGGMLDTLVDAALAGEDDAAIEARARATTEPIKEQGRELCQVAQAEHDLQDQIAAQLPAFRPYAVIDSDHDCHDDDREP